MRAHSPTCLLGTPAPIWARSPAHKDLQLRRKKLCKTRIQCEKLFSKLAFASAEQLYTSSRGQPRTGRGWLTAVQVAFISCSKSQRRKAKPLILEKLVCAEPVPPPGLAVASPPSRARRMPTAPCCTKPGSKSDSWGVRGHPQRGGGWLLLLLRAWDGTRTPPHRERRVPAKVALGWRCSNHPAGSGSELRPGFCAAAPSHGLLGAATTTPARPHMPARWDSGNAAGPVPVPLLHARGSG